MKSCKHDVSFIQTANALFFWHTLEGHTERCPVEALAVYAYLVHFESEAGYCSHSWAEMKRHFKWGSSRLNSALKWLTKRHIVTRQFQKSNEGRQKTNRYRIQWAELERLNCMFLSRPKPTHEMGFQEKPTSILGSDAQNVSRRNPKIEHGEIPKRESSSKTAKPKNEDLRILGGGGCKIADSGAELPESPTATTTTTNGMEIEIDSKSITDNGTLSTIEPLRLQPCSLPPYVVCSLSLNDRTRRGLDLNSISFQPPKSKEIAWFNILETLTASWKKLTLKPLHPAVEKLVGDSMEGHSSYELIACIENCEAHLLGRMKEYPTPTGIVKGLQYVNHTLYIDEFNQRLGIVPDAAPAAPRLPNYGGQSLFSAKESPIRIMKDTVQKAFEDFETAKNAFDADPRETDFVMEIASHGFVLASEYLRRLDFTADQAEAFIVERLAVFLDCAPRIRGIRLETLRDSKQQTTGMEEIVYKNMAPLLWPDWKERMARILDSTAQPVLENK